MLAVSGSAGLQLRCASNYAADIPAFPEASARAAVFHRHPRLRVAYVSGDLREHAVSYLLAGVLEGHDRAGFEVFGVSLKVGEGEGYGRRVREGCDRFIEVREWSDERVVEWMREQQVDIAVDLMGYTRGARSGIFARRCAPVQVNYLGYPGTLGAGFMDYLIADEFVIPPGSEQHYTEQVVRLPECFQPNDDKRQIGERLSREQAGLPANGVVYCSFNNSYKINPRMFEVWCRVLKAVPGSVLWLVGETQEVRENLWREGEARGVERERLIMARRLPYAQHLGRLGAADLFLDTLPFNAGTTASDALWAGLPVLTCAGEAFAARMAGSLLTAVGLPELITHDLEAYEALAIELGREPGKLLALRTHLQGAGHRSALFDTARYCRHLEDAYRQMHERAERGERPAGFSVAAQSRA
jgi:predicted O-linked N-acetylglucosamine transferase (SPINDLY family)